MVYQQYFDKLLRQLRLNSKYLEARFFIWSILKCPGCEIFKGKKINIIRNIRSCYSTDILYMHNLPL